MVRPRKKADYYQHFTDLKNDPCVRALRKKFGNNGYAVLHYLMEDIARTDELVLDFSEKKRLLYAAEYDVTQNELEDIVLFCIELEFFDFADNDKSKLSSPYLENELLKVLLEKRKRDRDRKQVKNKIEFSTENDIFSTENYQLSTENNENRFPRKTSDIPRKTSDIPRKTSDIPRKTPHSIVENSKDNTSLRSSLSPSTTPSSVYVCEGGQEEIGDIPMTAREGIEVLKKDRDWLLQMQRKFGLDAGSLVRWLESFSVDCDCLGKQDHNSIADIKQHFNAWMSKQKPKRTGGKKGADDDSAPLTSQQRWNKCHAELCQAVSPEECRQSFDVIRFERFEVSTSKLFIQVPNKETYEYMEHHLVDVMSRIIPKYFGANFKLQYHLP